MPSGLHGSLHSILDWQGSVSIIPLLLQRSQFHWVFDEHSPVFFAFLANWHATFTESWISSVGCVILCDGNWPVRFLVVLQTKGFSQMSNWYYESGGKKIGPVPGDTLHHLADHHAIMHDTNIWKDGMDSPVHASKIKNLFPVSVGNINVAHKHLTTALDAVMDEDEGRLLRHDPRLFFIHSCSGILIDYKIISIVPMTPPVFDPDVAAEKQPEAVRHLFEAQLLVTFCDRPLHPCPLTELRESKPGRRVEKLQLECTELVSGVWNFWDRVESVF